MLMKVNDQKQFYFGFVVENDYCNLTKIWLGFFLVVDNIIWIFMYLV